MRSRGAVVRKSPLVLVASIIAALSVAAPAWACTSGPHQGYPWLCQASAPSCGIFAPQSFNHTSQTTAYSRAEQTIPNTKYELEYTVGDYTGTGVKTCGTPTVFQLTAGGNADFTSDSAGNWTGGPIYLPTAINTYTECGIDTADPSKGTNHKLFTIT